jgi:chromosome segregation ATPase
MTTRSIAEIADALAQAARDLDNIKQVRDGLQTQVADLNAQFSAARDRVTALRAELQQAATA